jgi:hypothetical protein
MKHIKIKEEDLQLHIDAMNRAKEEGCHYMMTLDDTGDPINPPAPPLPPQADE